MVKTKSEKLFKLAQKYMPGGVNSPVRAMKTMGITPPFIKEAKRSRVFDVDGKEYIDYVGSWGAMILGHSHPKVIKAIQKAIFSGTSFGAPTELEIKLAECVVEAFDSIDLVRMVNSGTEAVMSAIRLARAYTNRSKIIKFMGCYHGHCDSLLVKSGSGLLTLGVPTSLGITDASFRDTIVLKYNDLSSVEEIFRKKGEEIACVILEPVAGNMGVIPPKKGFLKGIRKITEAYGALLIFDEVISGFRIAYGGAQEKYGVAADITCLGKIIGGGLPVGAYGGKKEIMSMVSPEGGVYQAGTLSGNPVAMAAGYETLSILKNNPDIYNELEQKAGLLEKMIYNNAYKLGIEIKINRVGSMMCIFFTENSVFDYNSALKSDVSLFKKYFIQMLQNGVYLPPSQFESFFISLAHSEEDIARTAESIRNTFDLLLK